MTPFMCFSKYFQHASFFCSGLAFPKSVPYLAQAPTARHFSSVKSETMHWTLRRAGYRGSKKDLNAWIREKLACFIQHGILEETRPQNILCWKGLAPI